MKSFSRPYTTLGAAAMFALGAVLALTPQTATAQPEIVHLLQEINPLLSHSQGYLGVLVSDVDNDSVVKLRLRDNHGAVITLIDHDAPAAQVGLRVNDVVLSVNGKAIEGAEQFGRLLRDIPAGHKVTLIVSRDGAPQTMAVQLVDRKAMEHDVWNKMNSGDSFPPPSGTAFLSGSGDAPSGWHMSLFGSSLKVGAMVDVLTPQMADYLGVQGGVMIKQVARKSDADAAGFKVHDVVLKVGADSVKTTADWERALRTNQGKQVQVTILRDRKQQVLNLLVDPKHHG